MPKFIKLVSGKYVTGLTGIQAVWSWSCVPKRYATSLPPARNNKWGWISSGNLLARPFLLEFWRPLLGTSWLSPCSCVACLPGPANISCWPVPRSAGVSMELEVSLHNQHWQNIETIVVRGSNCALLGDNIHVWGPYHQLMVSCSWVNARLKSRHSLNRSGNKSKGQIGLFPILTFGTRAC